MFLYNHIPLLWKKKNVFVLLGAVLVICGAVFFNPYSAEARLLRTPPSNLGLVGYWSFNEGSGTIATDFSGNGNDGTLHGNVTWVTGKRGKALDFGGDIADYFIKNPYNNFPTTEMTTSFWVKTTDNNGAIISYASSNPNNNDWLIFTPSSFQIYRGGAQATGVGIDDGAWHHVAVTWKSSGGELNVYIDGVSAHSGTALSSGSSITQGGALVFAQEQDSVGGGFDNNQDFTGILDEVRIYNRVLTAPEIAALYGAGSVRINTTDSSKSTVVNRSMNDRLTEGLTGLWSFDGADISGSTVYDRSGQGNDGTIVGSPKATIGKVGQALEFNGTNEYVSVASNAATKVSQNFSFAFWAKDKKGSQTVNRVLGKGQEYACQYFSYAADPIYCYYYIDGDLLAITHYADLGAEVRSEWTHIMSTLEHDGSQYIAKLYVNGALEDTTTSGGTNLGDTSNVFRMGYWAGYFEGGIDQVRIYQRTLSAAEALELYNLGR